MNNSNSGSEKKRGFLKQQQVESTRKTMLIWAAAASITLVVCIMVGINFIKRINYQRRVNDELTKTESTLSNDVSSIDDLITNVKKLSSNNNLTSLVKDDSSNNAYQIVIDAMPTEYNSLTLRAGIRDKILSGTGVSIESITTDVDYAPNTYQGDDDSTNSSDSASSSDSEGTSDSGNADTSGTSSDNGSGTATYVTTQSTSNGSMPAAQAVGFNMSFSGSSEAVTNAIENIEKSIRPISINSLKLEGTDSKLTASISAVTYYTPSVNLELGTKTVENGGNK